MSEPRKRITRRPPSAHRLVRLTGHLLAAVCVLAIAAWLAGRILSDRFAWSQWLLWIPTPVALAAALLGFLIAFRSASRPGLRRRRLLVWLAALLVIIAHFTFIEHRFLRDAPTDPEGFVVAHWTPAIDLRDRADEFAEHLRQFDADVTIVTNAAGAIWGPLVRQWLGPDHRPVQMRPFAVLTRLPVLEARRLVSSDGISVALVEIDAGETLDEPVTIYLIDLPSGPRLSRAEIASRVRRLLDEIDPPPPPPDLVVGDFNMTRDSAALRRIAPAMTHAFEQGGHGYGATYHRALPLYHIDHIMLANHLRCTRYDVLDPGHGRHRSQRAWIVAQRSRRDEANADSDAR